jgi:AraC-like DNA-binding protein/mannose-6-phosphate isomerase-like protein (cupin superfamily)
MPERAKDGPTVDVLAEIFETVHVENVSLSRIAVPQEGSISIEASRRVEIAVVLEGRALVTVGEQSESVGANEVFCLPKGEAYVLGNDGAVRQSLIVKSDQKNRDDSEWFSVRSPVVLRGVCWVSEPEKNPLLGVLPQLIFARSKSDVLERWVTSMIELLLCEVDENRPGASSVIVRIMEMLLVQSVRKYVLSAETPSHGWLRALSDSQIGGALGLIHEKPALSFTVASLAHAVGMSRSAFASQFTRLVGEPPLHYVARWRMLKAGLLLKDNKLSLGEIALAVGYESEAAFSKAFKRWSGESPGSYRRNHRTRESTPLSHDLVG